MGAAAFLLEDDDAFEEEEDADKGFRECWNAVTAARETVGRLSQSTPPRDSTL